MGYLVQIIKVSSGYAKEHSVDIITEHEFENEKDAKNKEKELKKEYELKKIGHTFLNNKGEELKTNY